MGRNGPIKEREMRRVLVSIATAMLLSACGLRPTAEQIAAADYGRVPKDPQQTVKEYLKTVLPDSESAQYYKWSNLSKTWVRDYHSGGILYGYRGCVYINSRNGFGVYDGSKAYLYTIRNDQVTSYDIGKPPEHMVRTLTIDPVTKACDEIFKTYGNYGMSPPAQMAAIDYGSVSPTQQADGEHIKTLLLHPDAAADYGSEPKESPRQKVMEYMKMRLLDSESAQYGPWSGLVKGGSQNYTGKIRYGYLGCLFINKKNRFGANDGSKLYIYLLRNNEVVYMDGGWPLGSVGDGNVISQCGSLFEVEKRKPTAEQIAAGDYGGVPKEPQRTVMEYMKTRLFHPESARYDKWSNWRKDWLGKFGEIYYGYKGCVYINAKSSQGTWPGFRPYVYLIKNDKVIIEMGDMDSGSEDERMIMDLCDPLYRTNTNSEAVKINTSPKPATSQQQVSPSVQRVNPKPLPIRVGE